MNNKYKIIYKLQFFFICGYLFSQEKTPSVQDQITNEVVVERHSNGVKKIVNVYRGKGVNEVMIAKYGFFDSGIKNFVSNYNDNKQNGLYTRWNADGIKVEEGTYKNSNMDGTFSFWYDNGNIDKKFNYKDDKVDGLQEWYYKNGVKSKSSEYSLGVKKGNFQEWYQSGQLKFNLNYKNNKKDGLQEEYLQDGTKTLESNMSNNKKNGSFKEWANNGKLVFSGNYKDGEMHGLQEYYKFGDENGEPNGIKTESFEYYFGELNGQFKEWNSNGKLKIKGNYKDGKYDGILETYHDNGEKSITKEYSLGVLNGKYSEFDEQGVLKVKGTTANGLMEGEWYFSFIPKDAKYNNEVYTCIINYKNGNMGDKGFMDIPWNGALGKAEYFYESGEKWITAEIKNGKPNGDYFEYFKNGNIALFMQSKDGEAHGKYIKKDSNGKLIKAYEEYNGQREPIVTVYNGDNLNGKKKSFYEVPIEVDLTKYSYYDDDDITVFNDNITSIDILPGYQIKVFEDDGFKGRYAIFNSDDILSHLKKFRMNDEISSFIIDVYDSPFVAVFFSDSDFKGKYFRYGTGQVKNMKKETNFNDDISSIIIKEGYRLKIYQNDSFKGKSAEITDNIQGLELPKEDSTYYVSNLKFLGLNDDISSFIIEKI